MNEDLEILKSIEKSNNVTSLDDFRRKSPTRSISNWKGIISKNLEFYKHETYTSSVFEGTIHSAYVKNALDVIDKLPTAVLPPEWSINADGTLLLEWLKEDEAGKHFILSVVFRSNDFLVSFLIGENIEHRNLGSYSIYNIGAIQNILIDYFERGLNQIVSA